MKRKNSEKGVPPLGKKKERGTFTCIEIKKQQGGGGEGKKGRQSELGKFKGSEKSVVA